MFGISALQEYLNSRNITNKYTCIKCVIRY